MLTADAGDATRNFTRSSGRDRVAKLALAVLVTLGSLLGVLLGGPTAHAQDSSGVSIQIQVKDQQRDANGKADNQPVPGVAFTILDEAGNEIGSAVTDEKGVGVVEVPEKGNYVVKIDEGTLPDGLALDAKTPAEQTIDGSVWVTPRKIVNVFTGQSQRVAQSQFDRVAQRFADGVRLGLIIAMCSVGLSLIFGTTGLTNFAHGEMVTFGAMVAYFLNDAGLHILLAAPVAVAAGGVFGWGLNDLGFCTPARPRRRSDLPDGDHRRSVDRCSRTCSCTDSAVVTNRSSTTPTRSASSSARWSSRRAT